MLESGLRSEVCLEHATCCHPPSSIGSSYDMTLLSAYEHNTLHNWMYSKNHDLYHG